MKTKYKFIEFVQCSDAWGVMWGIVNRKSKNNLGYVEYSNQWKQHVVEFNEDAIFNNSCLRDIADFLDQLNGVAKP